jgi:dihydroflavonol-4-reductase
LPAVIWAEKPAGDIMSTLNNTILVTGATGFVGSYVVRDLVQKGYAVKAIRRRNILSFYIDAMIVDKVQWIQGDIMDNGLLDEAMQDTHTVIHSAANVSFSDKDHDKMLAINIDGTSNVVNAAIENNIKRFVHVSSVAALGRNKNIVVNEKQVWEDNAKNTNYALSKYHGEMEVWRGIAEGLNGVIVNPSTILGYGDWNASSNVLFKNAYNGFPWYTNGINGFVDVEDVSKAIIALMENGISGERFILNSGNWSYREILDALADGFRKKRPHLLATPFLAGIAWRMERIKTIFTGSKTLLTKESAKVARGHTEYDNSKILGALPGFRFEPVKDTISRACEKYLQHLQV